MIVGRHYRENGTAAYQFGIYEDEWLSFKREPDLLKKLANDLDMYVEGLPKCISFHISSLGSLV